MTKRLLTAISVTMLAALTIVPAAAQIEADFPEVVLFATNSMNVGSSAQIFTGDVVVNDSPAGTLSFGNKAKTPAGWEVKANSIDVGTNVTLAGTEFCNAGEIFPCDGGALSLPVYTFLPLFKASTPAGSNVDVPGGGTETVTGDALDITIAANGTLVFTPGVHNVRSITAGNKTNIVFSGATEVRIQNGMTMGLEGNVNLSGAAAAETVVFYVGGNASLGKKGSVNANFYVPSGTLDLPSNVIAVGAFLAMDLTVGSKVEFNLASFFQNLPPVAVNDTATVVEDSLNNVIPVLGNDTDPNGDAIMVNGVDDPANGTATTDGMTVTYTPDADFFGTDVFNYEVCDDSTAINGNNCSTATITVTVTSVNDPPVVANDSATTAEDAPVAVAVLGNDNAGPANELQTLAVNSVTQGASGSVTTDGTTVTYTPNQDSFGNDSFSYTACDAGDGVDDPGVQCSTASVSVTVTSVNDQPVAVDDSASTPEETQVTVNLIGNDSAGPANELATLTVQPLGGAAAQEAEIVNNELVYTPPQDFFGERVFQYTVCDSGDGAQDATVLCDSAAVVITVSNVNDAPTADPQDLFATAAVTITLTGSDPDDDSLTFSVTTAPTKGTLGTITPIVPSGGGPVISATATYTPDLQLCSGDPLECPEDFFTFQVSDGVLPTPLTDTADVTINPGGDPTVDPPDLGEVEANDQLCISTNPVDCALETVEGTAITIVLTATAPCDPTGAPNPAEPCDGLPTAVDDVPLTFSLPSPTTSQGGTLSGLNQGTGELQEPPGADEVPQRSAHVLYTPPATFTGVDSFTFQVVGDVDGSGGIDPSAEPNPEVDIATVEISVQTFTPVPPVEARDQRVSTPKDTPVDISLSGPGEPCDPNTDPSCRQQPQGPASAPSGTVSQSSPAAPRSSRPVSYVADATGAGQYFGPTARARASISPGGGAPAPLAAATGEELYAIDSDLDQLFELSPVDASSTLVGSTAAGPTTPASLAFDGTDMFTIDLGGGGLYTLDLNTGVPTLVCSTGVSGWQGVASDPTDEGQFYGITQSDDLHKIDRTTCTTTRVNATAGTVGGLIAALEFDANGTLWGAEFGSPGSTTENAALVTIDKATGAVTVVSQCATRPCSGNDNFADGFQGIDFSTDGTLYGQNTNDDSLYIIDTTDGSLTFLGSNATIFVKGLAFSEEVLLEATFTILTLPAVGTLSYLEPLSGVQTDITAGDLPLALVTEQVTYTPPVGATGDPLASFTFQQSDGITSDTGLIELVVTGEIIIVDSCAEVGRPTGCSPGGQGPVSAPAPTVGGLPSGSAFTVSVSGPGDVSSNRPHVDGVSYRGLLCSADSDCRANFVPGSIVVLYARPVEAGSEFVEWGGDCSGSDPVALVTANPDAFCTATFVKTADE
ncbi:MAG: Ig-like domain-containing protein [Thermoanaerobaculia bacterium]